MNKNVSRLSADEKGRLTELNFTNGQIIVFSYGDEDKLIGAEIGWAKAEPDEVPFDSIKPKEEDKDKAAAANTASLPPPPPFSKNASKPQPLSQKTREDNNAREEVEPGKIRGKEKEKPIPPPPPPIKKEKEEFPRRPIIAEAANEKHVNQEGARKDRYCDKCQGHISETALFCGHCGAKQ